MSKRSPFWQPFTTRTPLGYNVAGFFNTEPGQAFGSIRFTHVDGPLSRPFMVPGLPVFARPSVNGQHIDLPLHDELVDVRAVERPDGTMIAFYPLFDTEGALVEVVARTRDGVVVSDTPWKPLATLVRQAMHAGIEEAVRRQRGVFVFSLVGAANQRLVSYPYRLRMVLQCVLRGSTGRVLASYAQMRTWSNQYGLDLPSTCAEFDPHQDVRETSAQLAQSLQAIDADARGSLPGKLLSSGLLLWASERGACTILDFPAALQPEGGATNPLLVWDAMARLADQGLAPTRERTAAALDLHVQADLDAAWERWALTYPQALSEHGARIAV